MLAVRYKGTRLSPGARVPVNATIELEVGEGKAEELIDTVGEDSVESAGEQLNLF